MNITTILRYSYIQHTANNSDFQQWILQDAGNGYFYIISKYNELCLDVANGIARNGTNIQLCQKTNHRALSKIF